MNKIVIVGNGFDLAHELPTSYQDFLHYLTNSIVSKIYSSKFNYHHEIHGQKCKRDGSFIHKLTEDKKEDPWLGAIINNNNHKIELKPNPHSTQN